MQITEHGFQLHHALTVKHDIHAEHAVGRGMLRAHGDFEEFAFNFAVGSGLGEDGVIRSTGTLGHVFQQWIGRGQRVGVVDHGFASVC